VPAIFGFALFWIGVRRRSHDSARSDADRNPLQIWAALQMALLFQTVLFGVAYANARFGERGLVGSALFLGIADVDALTLSMSRAVSGALAAAHAAAFALVAGILMNTVVKLSLALVIGRGAYRTRVSTGLAVMAAALGAALYWGRIN
jgi:uncharacterized membrane protein (DUF4010 family)